MKLYGMRIWNIKESIWVECLQTTIRQIYGTMIAKNNYVTIECLGAQHCNTGKRLSGVEKMTIEGCC